MDTSLIPIKVDGIVTVVNIVQLLEGVSMFLKRTIELTMQTAELPGLSETV